MLQWKSDTQGKNYWNKNKTLIRACCFRHKIQSTRFSFSKRFLSLKACQMLKDYTGTYNTLERYRYGSHIVFL